MLILDLKNLFLVSLILLVCGGFIGGQLAKRLGAPALLGMILAGILLGNEFANLISPQIMELADQLRTIAVMVILLRAGLGLDRDKLKQQGSVALRLGFLPAIAETLVIAVISRWLFGFDLIIGLLLGSVVAAESPAVIVPGMLKLKNLGYGVTKGIPDAILTGSALSDVAVLLVFSLLVNFLTQPNVGSSAIALLPLQVIGQIILGLILGYVAAKFLVWISKKGITQNPVQETLLFACTALFLVIIAQQYPYFSGYLAAMTMGFCVSEFAPPLARRMRTEFKNLWEIAQIVLFVLLGAAIQLSVLEQVLLPGLILLAVGLIFGRSWGWYLSTIGSNWNTREKLFLLPGNSAKATVQAAIGAIPLSLGIEGGEVILAIAALSILVTAPLGAWAIPTFAPKLLSKDPVDPTKTTVTTQTKIVAVVNDLETAPDILEVAGDRARRSNGMVIVLTSELIPKEQLKPLVTKLLLDLEREIICDRHLENGFLLDYLQTNEVNELVVAQANSSFFLNSSDFKELKLPLTVV